MSFTSLSFLLFFVIILIINYCLPQRYRWMFLLGASYYFYLNWQPIYAILLSISIVITYLAGRLLYRDTGRTQSRKIICATSIILLIAPLFLFKYYNFITSTIESFLNILRVSIEIPKMTMLLPLGISFYTFSAIGYIIDCYRNKYPPEKNIFVLALFISFFAQISSGPIPRGDQLIPQLVKPENLIYDNFIKGLHKLIWGFFMKLCVADRIGIYVDTVYNNMENHNGGSLLLASVLYTIQIYCDFAGYSLMAIGVARMLGIRLLENFRRPYFATSVKDFWSRWHISLSTWFRDYVYIPLGGNRVSKRRRSANLMTTFLVSGLWHGASWNFLTWGGIHGATQIGEKHWNDSKEKKRKWWKIITVFFIVSFAWVFFRLVTNHEIGMFWNKLFTQFGFPFADMTLLYIFIAIMILFIFDYTAEFKSAFFSKVSNNFWASNILCGVVLAMIALFGVFGSNSFIYFAF